MGMEHMKTKRFALNCWNASHNPNTPYAAIAKKHSHSLEGWAEKE